MSGVTDWTSSGADVAAAIGTVGALWLGALTLRRQVNDQHRAQAAAVTVTIQKTKRDGEVLESTVQNDSLLPIYEVMLIAEDHGLDVEQTFTAAMPRGVSSSIQLRDTSFMGCRAMFYVTCGIRRARDFTGQLRDITPKKPNLFRRSYLILFSHDPK